MRKTEWTTADGRRLASARRRRNQTQQECAAELKKLGATSASQGTVSNWEVGRTGPTSEESLVAIAKYCHGEDQLDGNGPDNHEDRSLTGASSPVTFEDLVAQLVGSRPLSDRQARLIDAVVSRLETGPPLSPDDGLALRLAARVVGFAPT